MQKHPCSIAGVFVGVVVMVMVFLASCLNPIDFDASEFALKVKAEVSGGLDVRSTDYAVLWIINRTGSVDVTSLTITRIDNPEGYPKQAAKPAHGSSYASYHPPTDIPYTITVVYGPTDPPNPNFTAPQCTGTITIPEKYMPKAGENYAVYLYRSKDGEILLEDEISKDTDPVDTGNPPEPPPAATPVYPLIVRNVTADMNVASIDFTINNQTLSLEGPKKKDETLNYLEAGQYRVIADLYKAAVGLPISASTPEKNVPVIAPNDSQSWHTLYIWIYKTKSGGYGITTTWPPNPNDAADVALTDIAGPGNGLLKLVNKSETGDVIKKVRISGNEVIFGGDNDNPSFIKDMEWMTVLSPGMHTVEFMPSRQNHYGLTLTVRIKEGEVTTVSYYDRLADQDLPPPDEGHGSGLIKVVNNSTGVVYNVMVRNTNTNSLKSYFYNQFTPPYPINYSKIGSIGVVGDANFPITEGPHYLILVELDRPEGYVVIERLAALKDQVVEIVINEQEIQKVHGANVTVVNRTGNFPEEPVEIVSVTLSNVANPGEASVFSGGAWVPSGYIGKNGQAVFRVNSSIGMPITSAGVFKAEVTLFGNGTGTVEKPVGSLYDTNPTITITDDDVPPGLKRTFIPVTALTGIPETLYTVLGTPSSFGSVNLNAVVGVLPHEASVQGPISWAIIAGNGKDLVSLINGVLAVKDSVGEGDHNKEVDIRATIPNAASNPSGNARVDFVAEYTIRLDIVGPPPGPPGPPPDKPVISFTFTGGGPITLPVGQLYPSPLGSMVTIDPPDAIVGGSLVTHGDIIWGSLNSGIASLQFFSDEWNAPYLYGNAVGDTFILATIPAGRTGTGAAMYVYIQVTITESSSPPPTPPPTPPPSQPPAPPPAQPTEKVLRIIRASGDKTVREVVLIHSSAMSAANLPPNSVSKHKLFTKGTTPYTDSTPLYQTGQTGYQWATANLTYYVKFSEAYPPNGTTRRYYTINLGRTGGQYNKLDNGLGTFYNEKYVDVTVPLRAANDNKYFVFFVTAGNGRVRGTSDGFGGDDLPYYNNYAFYVNLDELPSVTRFGANVIPIFVDNHHSIASIGIDFSASPAVNRMLPPLWSNEY
jgi:hypothetical protein